MLRSLISLSALTLLSSGALAADLPVFQPGPIMTAPIPMASNWTGFYVGVQGGYAFGGEGGDGFFDSEDDDFDEELSGEDRDGFTIGAKVGYDQQVNRFVVGAVADLNYLDFESEVDFESAAGDRLEFSESIDWFATLRGRAGFLVTETILVYGHGGLAFASTDSEGSFFDSDDDEDGVFGDDDDDNEWGWTLGAGVEAAVTQNIRVGLEYSYLNFGNGDDDDDDGSDRFDYDRADADFHTIRASASYKF